MGSVRVNEGKRAEMMDLVAKVKSATGMSNRDLASYFGNTAGALSTWSTGKSMGTNGERAALASLVGNARELVAARVATLEASLATHPLGLKDALARAAEEVAMVDSPAWRPAERARMLALGGWTEAMVDEWMDAYVRDVHVRPDRVRKTHAKRTADVLVRLDTLRTWLSKSKG